MKSSEKQNLHNIDRDLNYAENKKKIGKQLCKKFKFRAKS